MAKPLSLEQWAKENDVELFEAYQGDSYVTGEDTAGRVADWAKDYDQYLWETNAENAYNEIYAPSGMSREQFDALSTEFRNSPGEGDFLGGDLGTDPDQLAAIGEQAGTSESEAEFEGKRELEENQSLFEAIEKPELEEFTPEKFTTGADLDLQVSEFDEMDPSKWSDKDSAMQGSLDYMRNVMGGGEDDAANAEWNRRKGEAEQLSRANREASMRAMETQGMAGSGNELLADLEGQGQLTQSLFNSGLDAAGMQQNRRDAAAGSAYDMGGGIADRLDAWHVLTTQRDDANKVYDDSVTNQEIGANWNRDNFVSDQNVGLDNSAELYNLGLPQQEFANELGLAGAQTGQGVNIANFGMGYDQFNQGIDFEEFKFEQTLPNAYDKAVAGIGVAGNVVGAVMPG